MSAVEVIETAWQAWLVERDGRRAALRDLGESYAVRDALEAMLDRERAVVAEVSARLREQEFQTARWRERAETVARCEEAEFAERCRLAAQLHQMGFVVPEPLGVR